MRFGESHDGGGGERGQGEGERGTKVQWIDSYGKDLTQVFEFEPRYDTLRGVSVEVCAATGVVYGRCV